MTIRVGINGFGRIGRTLLRNLLLSGAADIDVVAINDPAPIETLAHLFEFDSLHGRLSQPVRVRENRLQIGSHSVRVSAETAPERLDWPDVDIAIESSGQFTVPDDALRHLRNGSKRVVLSAPAKGAAKTIVFGVNDSAITAEDTLISNGSCTTNCLVPVAKILHDSFGIERGMMTTVHSYTSTQHTHDAPHADLYRARAAAVSMIPTSTGAALSLGDVIPELAGRITGHAIRVPAPNVSCIDLVVDLARQATGDEINSLFRAAAEGPFRGIVDTTDRKLVSADFRQDPHSGIVACDQTRANGRMARVLAWYDNEWGFAHRLIDVIRAMGSNL